MRPNVSSLLVKLRSLKDVLKEEPSCLFRKFENNPSFRDSQIQIGVIAGYVSAAKISHSFGFFFVKIDSEGKKALNPNVLQ